MLGLPTEVLYIVAGADNATALAAAARPSADTGRGVGGRSCVARSALSDRPDDGDEDERMAFDSRLRITLPKDRRLTRPGDVPVNKVCTTKC